MDSSVKFQNSTSNCRAAGDKDQPSKKLAPYKKHFKLTLFIVTCLLVLLAVAAVVAVGVGVGVSVYKQTPQKGLSVIAISNEELRGEYHGSSGGIRFHVAVNSSFINLTVTTSSGEPVVHILHSLNSSMTMFGANNTNFLVMENQPGREKYADYVIPKNWTNRMESMVMGQKTMSDEVLQQLDNKTVDATRRSSLEGLAMREEAVLIIEAARALEGHMYGGRESELKAVRFFYLLAFELANARNLTDASHRPEATKNIPRTRLVRCSNGGGTCHPSACPFRRYTNNCFGMCGAGCSCWYVCGGDCCVHRYCLTHDQCCHDRGFWSWACWSVAWKYRRSKCQQDYEC